jgi:hypothetical protein
MYFCPVMNSSAYSTVWVFGDLESLKTGDAYGTFISFAMTNGAVTSTSFTTLSYTHSASPHQGSFLARPYTQLGTSLQAVKVSPLANSGFGNGGVAFPSVIDNALHLAPVYIGEPSSGIRGKLPGIWQIGHSKPFVNGDIITGTGAYAGRKFMARDISNLAYQCMIEISDTW